MKKDLIYEIISKKDVLVKNVLQEKNVDGKHFLHAEGQKLNDVEMMLFMLSCT